MAMAMAVVVARERVVERARSECSDGGKGSGVVVEWWWIGGGKGKGIGSIIAMEWQ